MAETSPQAEPQSADTPTPESLLLKAQSLKSRFLESYIDDLISNYVDPRDEFEGWTPLDVGLGNAFHAYTLAYRNEADLDRLVAESRQLCAQNEFAINAIENRISYVAGTGHTYQVVEREDTPDGEGSNEPPAPSSGPPAPTASGDSGGDPRGDDGEDGEDEARERLISAVQAIIDEFIERNNWPARQAEIVRRRDRDGECFLRVFDSPEGPLLRFVEPEEVRTPKELSGKLDAENVYFGIRYATDENGNVDMETPTGYFINGDEVKADQIQHRRANVDLADPRGVPTFYPVRKNLIRAAKILRNMSTVAEIQAAIAMVRKHANATKATIQQYVSDQADAERTGNTGTGSTGTKTKTYRNYAPGSILDTSAATEYDFPVAGVNVERFVAGIQAELRAVASRLVMPEFMLTSDASNANYSSTLVAEGPAVKMFERLQAEMIAEDTRLLERAIQSAIGMGRLPADTLELVEVQAQAPNVQSRDRLKEVQADIALVRERAMSKRELATRHDMDYDVQRDQIEEEADHDTAMFGLPMGGGMFGGGDAGGENGGGGNDRGEGGDTGDDDGNGQPNRGNQRGGNSNPNNQ